MTFRPARLNRCISSSAPFRRVTLRSCGLLEFVQIASAGYGQLIHLRLDREGIRACNGLGNFDVPIAEWNIAMMVNLARNLRGMIRNQESAVWDRSAVFQKEIRGSVLGIWGYGGIGRETARLAKTLGLRVHVMTRGGIRPRREMLIESTELAIRTAFCPTRSLRLGRRLSFYPRWTSWSGDAAYQEQRGNHRGKRIARAASNGFLAEPGPWTAGSGAGIAQSPPGSLDCRGCARYSLRLSTGAQPPVMAFPQCDSDATHFGFGPESAVSRSHLGHLCAECRALAFGQVFVE